MRDSLSGARAERRPRTARWGGAVRVLEPSRGSSVGRALKDLCTARRCRRHACNCNCSSGAQLQAGCLYAGLSLGGCLGVLLVRIFGLGFRVIVSIFFLEGGGGGRGAGLGALGLS